MSLDLTSNQPMSMWEIYTRFVPPENLQSKEGKPYEGPKNPQPLWMIPSHQRKLAWSKSTIDKWISKLVSAYNEGGIFLPGAILTYTTQTELKYTQTDKKKYIPIYINDGAQRSLWVNQKLYEYCKKEDLDFKEILSSIKIQVQRKNYADQKEAIKDFLEQNIQTGVTPYEMGRTRLCDTFSDYSSFWEPRIERVHDIIRSALIEVGIQVEKLENNDDRRETLHKRKRDDLHLFWKFISKDKSLYSPDVGANRIKRPETALDLEDKLSKILLEIGAKKIDQEIERFNKQVDLSAALYRQTFSKIHNDNRAPAETNFRWWLLARIYFLNKKWPIRSLNKFTKLLIEKSRGKSSLYYKDKNKEQATCNMALAKIKLISTVSKIIKFDIESLEKKKPRKKSDGLNRRGIHDSHIVSYAENGKETIPEAGLLNMSRGAALMTSEEILDLSVSGCGLDNN